MFQSWGRGSGVIDLAITGYSGQNEQTILTSHSLASSCIADSLSHTLCVETNNVFLYASPTMYLQRHECNLVFFQNEEIFIQLDEFDPCMNRAQFRSHTNTENILM